MSTLPKAIQREVEQADAAQAAIQQQAQVASETVVTDAAQLAPANEPGAQQQQVAPAPQPQPSEDWQQKYRSLQGMFAQKTGELQAQNKAYESQLMQMQRQIEALAQTRKQDEVKEKTAADPNDVENFGADLVGMVQRYAERVFRAMSEQFSSKAQELDGRVVALEREVMGVSQRTNVTLEQQFYATLAAIVPDWERVNADNRWLEWLGESDPVYGATRQVALDAAYQALDAQRVANVFKAFKATLPTTKPAGSLANQVAPNGAAIAAPAGPAAKQLISSKFIEKFYGDLAKGKYNGRDAEAARIEAEINTAAAEGRIR